MLKRTLLGWAVAPLLLACAAPPAARPLESNHTPTAAQQSTLLSVTLDEPNNPESLLIELFPDAAPQAVATVLRLVGQGAYDLGAIDYAWPHVEVAIRSAGEPATVFQEIDATALGLDRALIGNAGEAMDTWQFVLTKADRQWKRHGSRPAQYTEWLEQFEQTGSAKFLLGVSRLEINQLLGFSYQTGLATRRAVKGAVYLEALSPLEATTTLRILLTDRPQLDGKVTVIGHVRRGLHRADAISILPAEVSSNGRRTKTPVSPVAVREIRVLPTSAEGKANGIASTEYSQARSER